MDEENEKVDNFERLNERIENLVGENEKPTVTILRGSHHGMFWQVPKIDLYVSTGKDIHTSPWRMDSYEDINVNSKYILSGKQRKLVKTGNVKDRSRRNKSVLKKRDLLPERIRHLIDDVVLLYDSPYLSDEAWEYGRVEQKDKKNEKRDFQDLLKKSESLEEVQKNIAESGKKDFKYYDTPFESPADLWNDLIQSKSSSLRMREDVFINEQILLSRETQFGFELGSLAWMLHPNFEDSPPGIDLIWGFILAFIGHSKENIDNEQKQLKELVKELESKHEVRQEKAEKSLIPDNIDKMVDSYNKEIELGVEAAGITPHPRIIREVKFHMTKYKDQDLQKKAAKEIAVEISDLTPVKEVDSIRRKIVNDLKVIKNRSKPGIESTRDILKEVWDLKKEGDNGADIDGNKDRDITSIKFKTSNISSRTDMDATPIAKVLYRVSTAEDYDLWTSEPLFYKINVTGGPSDWKLTSYGALLSYITFERDDMTDWLYWYALGPEEISLYERKLILNTLDELNFIDYI